MSKGKVALGVLAGVAAGAVLGVLFAPDKGEKTRKKITRTSDKYLDDVKEKINDLVCSVTDHIESIKHDHDEAMRKAKKKMENVKSAVTD